MRIVTQSLIREIQEESNTDSSEYEDTNYAPDNRTDHVVLYGLART